jgi:hypothetical protein
MQRSNVVEAGRRMLMHEAGLTDVRAFTRAVTWLVDHGLIVVKSDDPHERGRGARTFYELTFPDGTVTPERPFGAVETVTGTVTRAVARTVATGRPRSSSASVDQKERWLTSQGIGYCDDPRTFREEAGHALGVIGPEAERLLELARQLADVDDQETPAA